MARIVTVKILVDDQAGLTESQNDAMATDGLNEAFRNMNTEDCPLVLDWSYIQPNGQPIDGTVPAGVPYDVPEDYEEGEFLISLRDGKVG